MSAQAEDYQYIIDGKMYFMDGTTCSVTVRHSLLPDTSTLCDLFSSTQLTVNVQTAAGIVSLVNDFLISHDKGPLGELNPLLYLLSLRRQGNEGIDDVTSGSNPGCDTFGFAATPGWDPVRAACIFSESFSTLS